MRILHVLSSVNPDGGGPTEGVRQRGIRLRQMGHVVEVATLDAPDAEYLNDYPLTVHAKGPPRGRYRYSPRLLPWLKAHVGDYDAIVINGLWQYHSFAAWMALRGGSVPYFVFTHGMLDPWFKRAYPLKHLKKWLYWPWTDYRVLRDATAVLFTSDEERLQARQSFWLYRAQERVVAYGTKSPPSGSADLRERFLAVHPELRGQKLLLFLSRIHEKKGCDLLIRAFAEIAAADASRTLVIAGPDQTGWKSDLTEMARQLGVAERIVWPGMLRDDLKWGAFYSAEAFVLPSHQENFGIVVAEALGCGVPVLISDKVNIWREVAQARAGYVAPDTMQGTALLLRQWLATGTEERAAMRRRALDLYSRQYTVEAMATGLLDVIGAPA